MPNCSKPELVKGHQQSILDFDLMTQKYLLDYISCNAAILQYL